MTNGNPQWQPLEYPVCAGDGWTTSILYWGLPDHEAAQDPEKPAGMCYCGHVITAHDPEFEYTDVWKMDCIRVLNLTTGKQRMTIGDFKTQNEVAYTSAWFDPGVDSDFELPGCNDSGQPGGLYFDPNGYPFRVQCL